MNTLLICLCIGQIVCAFLLAMIGYHAIQDREEAIHELEEAKQALMKVDVHIWRMEQYMAGHGLPVPCEEELADYINDLEDNA